MVSQNQLIFRSPIAAGKNRLTMTATTPRMGPVGSPTRRNAAMKRTRGMSEKKPVVCFVLLFLVVFLLGPMPTGPQRNDRSDRQAPGGPAISPEIAADTDCPGAVERTAPAGKKRGIKPIWLIIAGSIVVGVVVAYLILTAAKGNIDVQSEPAGAIVFLDDQDTGQKTPTLLEKVKTGSHTLTLKKEHCQDATVSVTVEKKRTTQVTVELLATAMTEDFNDGRADDWTDNGYGTWDVQTGVYRFQGGVGGGGEFAYSWYTPGNYSDFTLKAKIRNGGDQGLAFRGNPVTGDWYVFYAWGSQWAVFRYSASGFTYLIPYTPSLALKSYPAWNVFKVVAKGANFGFYINDVLVGSAYDMTLAKGKIGFQVRDYAGVTMEMDDVSASLNPVATHRSRIESVEKH